MISLLVAVLVTGNTPQLTEPKTGCVWSRCGKVDGRIVNCQPQESGTPSDLALVEAATRGGAVVYKCKEGER